MSEENERVLGFFDDSGIRAKNSQHLGWPKVSFQAGSPSGFPGVQVSWGNLFIPLIRSRLHFIGILRNPSSLRSKQPNPVDKKHRPHWGPVSLQEGNVGQTFHPLNPFLQSLANRRFMHCQFTVSIHSDRV